MTILISMDLRPHTDSVSTDFVHLGTPGGPQSRPRR